MLGNLGTNGRVALYGSAEFRPFHEKTGYCGVVPSERCQKFVNQVNRVLAQAGTDLGYFIKDTNA